MYVILYYYTTIDFMSYFSNSGSSLLLASAQIRSGPRTAAVAMAIAQRNKAKAKTLAMRARPWSPSTAMKAMKGKAMKAKKKKKTKKVMWKCWSTKTKQWQLFSLAVHFEKPCPVMGERWAPKEAMKA